MNRTFIFQALMLVSLFLPLVTSCGSDDDNNDNNDKIIRPKRITKIIEESKGEIREREFTYDSQGRVILMKTTLNSSKTTNAIYTRTYQYGETLIIQKEEASEKAPDSYYYDRTYTYSLSNGRITKRTETRNNISRVYEYSYDNYGYMNSFKEVYSLEDEEINHEYQLNWDNGNLISFNYMNYTLTPFTYSDLVWRDGLIFDMNLTLYPTIDPILYATGFYGKTPKNIPSKYENISYQYSLSGGLVTKVIRIYEDINNKDLTETSVYTITWE